MRQKQLVPATALIALLALSFACGSAPAEPDKAEPDKVVGVLLKCTKPSQRTLDASDNLVIIPARELSAADCERLLAGAPDRQRAISGLNALHVVTVRTSTGGSYTVEVPATTRVRVGQVWPSSP